MVLHEIKVTWNYVMSIDAKILKKHWLVPLIPSMVYTIIYQDQTEYIPGMKGWVINVI